jgi:hypothetical protein
MASLLLVDHLLHYQRLKEEVFGEVGVRASGHESLSGKMSSFSVVSFIHASTAL